MLFLCSERKLDVMELDQLWQSALGEVELQISRPNFVTWLKNSRLAACEDGVATVALPNTFAKEWVQNKYHKLVLGALRSRNDSVKSVIFLVSSGIPQPTLPKTKHGMAGADAPISDAQGFEEFAVDPETNLNPRYTLNSFVVGHTNELAHAAALGVVDAIGTKYNPLFIYGGVGLGKTHLIQAIGNEIKTRYQNKVRVRYVPSEKFTNEVVSAIRNKRMEDTKEKYRNVDVLIIDDIQFIGGKARTEEEFFHTFNALYENNKQIIISSDRPPRYIPTLEERLRSRFQGGMIADISAPDYELRLAVLKTKLQERNTELPDAIVELIATKAQKNLRDLGGILNRLIFYQQSQKHELTTKFVDKIIDETVNQPVKNVSSTNVLKVVADHFQVPVAELTGKSRRQEVAEPRQVAAYLLREILDLSYPCIGDKLGKRDHTTAMYAYMKIAKALEKDTDLQQKVLLIKDDIMKEVV